MPALLHEGLL